MMASSHHVSFDYYPPYAHLLLVVSCCYMYFVYVDTVYVVALTGLAISRLNHLLHCLTGHYTIPNLHVSS